MNNIKKLFIKEIFMMHENAKNLLLIRELNLILIRIQIFSIKLKTTPHMSIDFKLTIFQNHSNTFIFIKKLSLIFILKF